MTRRGFTLIELLVVLAVVSVLMGLLLPAVQKVRDATARLKCKHNLRQLGLALHSYESAQQKFPPLAARPTPITDRAGSAPAWTVLLLPYIEQDNLFRLWRLDLSFGEQVPAARDTPVPVYFCPSQTERERVPEPVGRWNWGASGDYAASAEFAAVNTSYDRESDEGSRRAFRVLKGTRVAEFTDGLSGTLLLGEKALIGGDIVQGGYGSFYSAHNPCYNARAAGKQYPIWKQTHLDYSGNNLAWNHPTGGGSGNQRFGSPHPGICHFTFADGSVHVLSMNLDRDIVELLARREDGQPIPGY